MPVTVDWDDVESDVLLLNFEGMWTFDEAYVAGRRIAALCAEASRRIDIISTLVSNFRPGNFSDGSNELLMRSPMPSNVGAVVLIVNDFDYTIFSTYSRGNDLGFKYTYAPSIAQARELIRALRQGEPPPDYYTPPQPRH